MKRLIILIFVVAIVIMVLNISVYATSDAPVYFNPNYLDDIHTSDTMSTRDYELYQHYLIEDFTNGHLTYDQFKIYSEDVTNAYLHYNSENDVPSSVALNASNKFNAVCSKIADTVSKWGDGARERVAEWWNGVTQNVPTEETKTPTTDLNGYGAIVYQYIPRSDGTTAVKRLPCDYIVVRCNDDGEIISYKYCTNDGRTVWQQDLRDDGTWFSYAGFSTPSNFATLMSDRTYKFFGDVRYEDDRPAPTDDEFEYSTIKKFDEMPDKDLEDLLDDFAEEAERQNPDLSSIEGLLKAIYARMGTLDSDNDNALLSAINANILALVNADKDKDEADDKTNEELVNTLLEIRDSLKNGTLGTAPEAHGHEISGTVYNVIPLDKDWLNNMVHNRQNLKVNYQGQIYYLENCGCLKLGDKYYTPNMNYDEYSSDYYNIDDLPSFTFDSTYIYSNGDVQTYSMSRNGLPPVDDFLNAGNSAIQPFIDKAVNEMSKAFTIGIPYDDIKHSLSTFQSIVFNNHEPKDIVISINGQQITILSATFSTYLTGGVSSSGGNNEFNYGDLLNGGGSSLGGSEHGGGGTGGNRDNNTNSSNAVSYSNTNSTPVLATYVKIVRSFSSILIGFAWTLSMRKKIVAMI